jgi:hypothetical protein
MNYSAHTPRRHRLLDINHMALPFLVVDTSELDDHKFSAIEFEDNSDWMEKVATEYVRLRTECVTTIQNISLDGIQVLEVDTIKQYIQKATIPPRSGGNFDVTRSDLGETLCYMILEQEYRTMLGYKSVRDRELINFPGRGIDAIGIENDGKLILVLGEVKVSNASASPPQVVDTSDDSLRNQHLGHLNELNITTKKIWNLSRHVLDATVRDLLFTALWYLEEQRLDKLRLVVCCVLVRPRNRYTIKDFGTFIKCPADYQPAHIRFIVVCLPGDVETVVDRWYATVKGTELPE